MKTSKKTIRNKKIHPRRTSGGKETVTAVIRLLRNGAGSIVHPENGEIIYIESGDLGTALNGDTVAVSLFKRDGELKGRVRRIESRCAHDIVGTFTPAGKHGYVVPLNPVYKREFFVPSANGAKSGDRVVIRLVNWRNPAATPEGAIVDVIGPSDRPSLDTKVVMRQFDLPESFPQDVLDEAEHVASRLEAPGERIDLRSRFIFTIDPATAKDFDDAISLEHDKDGNRVLGVHIADVSFFVEPGSALDREARERGTSVYLVDRVVPMLPEQLSNGICSLRPDEDRLAFSVFMTFDSAGRMIARSFARSIIRSKLRLSYEEAMAIMKRLPLPPRPGRLPGGTTSLLQACGELAAALRKRRFDNGALDLDVPEVEVVLDAEGRMTGLLTRPYDESHQMIEEFMVAANEAVATELRSRGVDILSRLHEPPAPDKLEECVMQLSKLGFRPGDISIRKNFANFLRSVADHPLRAHVHTLLLRSMKRAVYSAEESGHFGLAKAYYAHFTSPIRRYPDLVLHRQLSKYLVRKASAKFPRQYLQETAGIVNEREMRADDASRQLIEIKKFRFLQQQIDSRNLLCYEAVIVKCTSFGAFIDIPALAMGGMVHVSQLCDAYLRFDARKGTLSAGKKVFGTGTKLKVIVSDVDFNQRRADFIPLKR